MELKREWIEWFQKEGFDVRTDYPGRGMFGKTCFGIVGDHSTLVKFITYVCEVLADQKREWLTNVRTDDMGLRTIYYWPEASVIDRVKEVKNDAT